MQTFALRKSESLQTSAAERVFGLIRTELSMIETEFERQASSNIQVIDYLGDYLRMSGGKRVRPALLVLANHAVGGDGTSDSVIRMATVMEMLHTATLVHDDVIDNAATRRDRSSVNARFGNQAAVLMGDWLYMSAFETSLGERSLTVLDILTRLTRIMTEGELLQLTMLGRSDISEDDYFDILRRKTAFLFAACCEIGAVLGGSNDDERKALHNYGLNLGIAFQIIDDLLDFTSYPDALGKPSGGADLVEGKVTLPLIILREAEPRAAEILREVMLSGEYRVISRSDLVHRLGHSGALAATRSRASEFGEAARKNLEVLPETEYRSALDEFAAFVVDRSR